MSVALLLVIVGQSTTDPVDWPDAVSGVTEAAPTLIEPTVPPEGIPSEATLATPLPPEALPVSLALSLAQSPTPADSVPWALGPAIEGRWLRPTPFFFGATFGLNTSWSANDSWEFSRTGLELLVSAGVSATRGVGRFFASVSGGAEAILERKSRQGSTALAETPQGKARWRYTVGPCAALEVGAGVTFWGPVGVEVGAGPAVSAQKVTTDRRTTVGLHSRLGLTYAF